MTVENILLEDVRIGFRNFAGKPDKFNREGNRNFVAFIDDEEQARDLEKVGWNIKHLKPREEDGVPLAYLPIAVNYNVLPPRIVLISNGHQQILDEESVEILDWAEIDSIDILVRPYEWEVQGTSGIKAYVKTMYVVLEEDPLTAKYYVPDEQL